MSGANPPGGVRMTGVNPPGSVKMTGVNPPGGVRMTGVNPPWSEKMTDVNPVTMFLFLCRHFLFKTGTGSTAFFGTATPGYTMATGAVYSTPARPLPRSSLSRGAFKFKKSPRHCSWRCTALGAVGVATLLSLILCYCIGKT